MAESLGQNRRSKGPSVCISRVARDVHRKTISVNAASQPLRIVGISRSVSPPAQNKTPRSRSFATVGFKLREYASDR